MKLTLRTSRHLHPQRSMRRWTGSGDSLTVKQVSPRDLRTSVNVTSAGWTGHTCRGRRGSQRRMVPLLHQAMTMRSMGLHHTHAQSRWIFQNGTIAGRMATCIVSSAMSCPIAWDSTHRTLRTSCVVAERSALWPELIPHLTRGIRRTFHRLCHFQNGGYGDAYSQNLHCRPHL